MTVTSGIQVISRAAAILRQLKHDTVGQSLGEIASETGLPRSTVQRIVNALIVEGFVASSGRNGGLTLGPELQSLAAAGRVDVVKVIRPALEALSRRTGETVDLAAYVDGQMTIVDQVQGRHRLAAVSIPGEAFPLTTTANGKAVLARLSDREVADAFLADRATGDLPTFQSEIETVRQAGVAFDLDDHTTGISAAGVSFQSVTGEVFAVSIPAPSERFAKKRREIIEALDAFLRDAVVPNRYFHVAYLKVGASQPA